MPIKPKDKPIKYEVPGWSYIYELCIQLADEIVKSKYKPDLLVAVARGGWIPGRLLSDILDEPEVATIKVEHYVDIYKTLKEPEITQPLPIDVRGKKMLVIDDIADSGRSLKLVKEYLLKQGAADVRIAALYRKPWSEVIPEYCARVTDAWIVFPHEAMETIGKIYRKLKKQGKSEVAIEKELISIGMNPLLIQKFLPKVAKGKKG